MPILGFLKDIISPVTNLVDKIVKDPDQANQLKHELEMSLAESFDKTVQAQRDIIVAEAQSESWLAANWRPVLMLSFTAIIVNNYILSPYLQALFGFSVNLEIPVDMWDLLKVGVGGYIFGRSGEKMIKTWKEKS